MKFDQAKFQSREVTKEDVEKLFEMDAIYTNKFYCTVQSDGMVRLCFAEVDPNDTFMNPRFVTTIPFGAFAALGQLIATNMENIKKFQEAVQQQQPQVQPFVAPKDKAN